MIDRKNCLMPAADEIRRLWQQHTLRKVSYEIANEAEGANAVATVKLSDSREFELFLLTMVMVLYDHGDMLCAEMLRGRMLAFLPHLKEEYAQFSIEACWLEAHITNQMYDDDSIEWAQ